MGMREKRPVTHTESFTYATPVWGIRLILFIFTLFGLGMGWLAYNFETLLPGEPVGFKYFFWTVAGVAALVVLRPSKHRRQAQFIADRNGVTFPARQIPDLHVGWERIGEIRLGLVDAEWDGFSIEMRLTDDEIKTYFNTIRLTKKFHLQPLRNKEGYFSVGFADAFVNRRKAVGILNQIKAQANRPRGHWVDDG